MSRVYSLVASLPFSPVDVDLNLLARGEWDSSKDRLRVWFLPRKDGQDDKTSCYVMIRKFDQQQAILVCVHIVMNSEVGSGEGQPFFTLGILSNDDIRARAMLGVFLGVPPIFHRRSEVKLIESNWRSDPSTVMRYTANVHSVLAASANPGGKVYRLEFEPTPDVLASLKPNLDTWWDSAESENQAKG
jgi:hypothetical protein